ncbi:ectonucleotide pyrophosphatase/phosphodiesterase [Sporosarcina luteola]|uniref:alkaline phosphatase family protein n=1 Tax=Sporosarcina luteola TaxID=582850 RepID=UPI00203D1D5F|nr:ectonucleotide pyrophosphatase/phosphodiesterase [Sporosarcina luteola]MCM3637502.1 ectonucleotide pyrophosphatase/phosphodiesterase [Sporosarcina luteola]
MKRLTDHLIVISFDCLSSLDMPLLETLPNFRKLLSGAAKCKQVNTIYPSVTYSCHTSIITGNYPIQHRITTNTLLQPGKKSPDWYWQRRNIKGTTLFDEANKAGMKTAALLWPVTARANIDFHIPEIFANRPWHSQVVVSLVNGSLLYTIRMNQLYGHMRKGIQQPWLDDFVTAAAVHTITSKKPDLLLIHLVDLDFQRHIHGFASKEADEALRRHDERLGDVFQALEESGIAEKSTIVALGDHSSIDISKVIKLNVLLEESGLIKVNKKGQVKSWRAFCKSNDGSAYIYLNDPEDRHAEEKVQAILHSMMRNPENGIEFVLSGKEASETGADNEADFMLEARAGFYFTEELDGEAFSEITEEDLAVGRYSKAVYGYSPLKPDYETVFIAKGSGITPDVEIPTMSLVDEGPTFARILGLDLGETDGRILHEILES